MRLLYSLFITLYTLVIYAASSVNSKARKWAAGRKHWKKKLQSFDFSDSQVFWFHCASLGEFEQARPLIEDLKATQQCKIVLTFFSPSGYEVRKDYAYADKVLYLPYDSLSNAAFFISHLKPKAVFFIKYEFWFNYLYILKKNQVPVYLVSGIFREKQYFFSWYGQWFAKQLSAFNYFFVQNDKSLQLLKKISYINCEVTGDTRFDRVFEIMQQNQKYSMVDEFTADTMVCVAGSTYYDDEMILEQLPDLAADLGIKLKLIIAPHVVSNERFDEIETIFGANHCVRFSKYNTSNVNRRVMIIDNIGMLSSLYAYATFAYIGGGFGKGLHNTLEAAVYGMPLIFGKNYTKFAEAIDLVNNRAAFAVNDLVELKQISIRLMSDIEFKHAAGQRGKAYVQLNRGAVKKILNVLRSNHIIK